MTLFDGMGSGNEHSEVLGYRFGVLGIDRIRSDSVTVIVASKLFEFMHSCYFTC